MRPPRLALAAGLAGVLGVAGCGAGRPLGTVPNGGTQRPQGSGPARVHVRLAAANATHLGGTAVLTPARDREKTRLNVSLGRRPAAAVSVEIGVGSCGRKLSLRAQLVLGTMRSSHASWRVPVRLATLLSTPAAVVVRTGRAAPGGPVAACGAIGGAGS